jgi:hypothetical protein
MADICSSRRTSCGGRPAASSEDGDPYTNSGVISWFLMNFFVANGSM